MDRLFWNGSDWRRIEKTANYDPELTYMMKVGYVNGVLDGRLFYYLKAWTMEQAFADSLYAETVDYLSPRELVKVLDNFYADPINGYIPLPSAIIIFPTVNVCSVNVLSNLFSCLLRLKVGVMIQMFFTETGRNSLNLFVFIGNFER